MTIEPTGLGDLRWRIEQANKVIGSATSTAHDKSEAEEGLNAILQTLLPIVNELIKQRTFIALLGSRESVTDWLVRQPSATALRLRFDEARFYDRKRVEFVLETGVVEKEVTQG